MSSLRFREDFIEHLNWIDGKTPLKPDVFSTENVGLVPKFWSYLVKYVPLVPNLAVTLSPMSKLESNCASMPSMDRFNQLRALWSIR